MPDGTPVEFWRALEEVEGPAALMSADATVSYSELKRRARASSAGLNGLVSLHFPKSIDYVVALLACWWAKAAFVPIDPGLPAARQQAILRAARPDQEWRPGQAAKALGSLVAQDDLAYVIGTSGSTGQPKAVEILHDGLVPMLRDQIEAFDLGPGKRALWLLSTQFDASLSDLGTALLSGATLCLPPADAALELPYWLDRFAVTHVDLPPALLRRYRPEDFPDCVETLVVGGEPSPPEVLRRWAERFRVISVYGPTEATICTHLRQVDQSWDAPYLGEPIGGMSHRLLDGELWLSGPGLARGYRQGQSASFVQEGGTRYYRTGDRVSASLEYQGRFDRQVKVRGHRVELEEIENHLLAQGASRAAALVSGERLLAYYESDRDVALDHLLPGWMVPRLRRLERLPLTASGKPDRQALQSLADFEGEPLDSLGSLRRAAELQALGIAVTAVDLLGGSPSSLACEDLLRLAPPPPLSSPAPGPFGPRVLLTGAHGQLGRRLLSLLLPDYQVTALVRRPLPEHPNLRQIIGDLEGPWEEPEVDCVLHCAAVVNAVLPLERLRAVNLDSLERLLKLGKPLHYASTLSVFVSTDFQGTARVDELGSGHVYGGYAQSKWLAERWLSGLDGVWCYRYGLLLGYPEDSLRTFVAGLLSLGAYPTGPEIRLDTTPIDWAARATLQLASREPAGVFHLASRGGVSLREIVEHVAGRGHRLLPMAAKDFFALPVRNAQEGAAMLGLCRLHPDPAFFRANRALDLFAASDVRFELSLEPPPLDLDYLAD